MHESAAVLAQRLIKTHCPASLAAVIEVGSLRVRSNQWDPRSLFGGKAKYFGIDMQAGDGVDVVVPEFGQWNLPIAATLTLCFNTLEHCHSPWEVMGNIACATETGGIVIAIAPFAWPVHGYPSDYFRFTGNGLSALFDYAGIETIECGEQHSEQWKMDAWAVGRVT